MLDVKQSNNWTVEEVYKNELDIMRFRHNEVNFEAAFSYTRMIIQTLSISWLLIIWNTLLCWQISANQSEIGPLPKSWIRSCLSFVYQNIIRNCLYCGISFGIKHLFECSGV